MTAEPPTEYHMKSLSLTEGCTGSPESTLLKMPHCWKSRVAAHFLRTCRHVRIAMSVKDVHLSEMNINENWNFALIYCPASDCDFMFVYKVIRDL